MSLSDKAIFSVSELVASTEKRVPPYHLTKTASKLKRNLNVGPGGAGLYDYLRSQAEVKLKAVICQKTIPELEESLKAVGKLIDEVKQLDDISPCAHKTTRRKAPG